MRSKDFKGYMSLIAGLATSHLLQWHTTGLFLMGMALGFFGSSIKDQLRERNDKKKRIKKAKAILEKIKNLDKPVYCPPKGQYDDLYFKCVDILNEQDELEVTEG